MVCTITAEQETHCGRILEIERAGQLAHHIDLHGSGCDVAGSILGDNLDGMRPVRHPEQLVDDGARSVEDGKVIHVDANGVHGVGGSRNRDDRHWRLHARTISGRADFQGKAAERRGRRLGGRRNDGQVRGRRRRHGAVGYIFGQTRTSAHDGENEGQHHRRDQHYALLKLISPYHTPHLDLQR